jgi:hypothetical protein
MKSSALCILISILFNPGSFSQGKYIPIFKEHYFPVYGDYSGIDVRVPVNAPWYVFSDRNDNPVFPTATGTEISDKIPFGRPFLVIGLSEKRLQVIDIQSVNLSIVRSQWDFRTGVIPERTIMGWMDTEKLLLNRKCLKSLGCSACTCFEDAFDLQIFALNQENYSTCSSDGTASSPGKFPAEFQRIWMGRAGIRYVYKIVREGGQNWYLTGNTPEIDPDSDQITLTGWTSEKNSELIKHRIFLEYDWQKASERYNKGKRLTIPAATPVSQDSVKELQNPVIVDAESNYYKGVPSADFYFKRALGTGFRFPVYGESFGKIQIGILKNNKNTDSRILDAAVAVAAQKLVQLYANETDFQEKIHDYISLNGKSDSTGVNVRKDLEEYCRSFIRQQNISLEDVSQMMDWVVFYLSRFSTKAGELAPKIRDELQNYHDYLDVGYLSKNNDSSGYFPFQYVVLLNDPELDRIREFARDISVVKGRRSEIQRLFYNLLLEKLAVYQDVNQVNALTLGQAISRLTGIGISRKFERIKIGEITQSSVFPDRLMYAFIFEWGITYGYLLSLKERTWKIDPAFLRSCIPIINALLKSKKKLAITYNQLVTLSHSLEKKDKRPVNEYFRNYPFFYSDVFGKEKSYWIEAGFFPRDGSDFTQILLNSVK